MKKVIEEYHNKFRLCETRNITSRFKIYQVLKVIYNESGKAESHIMSRLIDRSRIMYIFQNFIRKLDGNFIYRNDKHISLPKYYIYSSGLHHPKGYKKLK